MTEEFRDQMHRCSFIEQARAEIAEKAGALSFERLKAMAKGLCVEDHAAALVEISADPVASDLFAHIVVVRLMELMDERLKAEDALE